jgi:hypothetical protein
MTVGRYRYRLESEVTILATLYKEFPRFAARASNSERSSVMAALIGTPITLAGRVLNYSDEWRRFIGETPVTFPRFRVVAIPLGRPDAMPPGRTMARALRNRAKQQGDRDGFRLPAFPRGERSSGQPI